MGSEHRGFVGPKGGSLSDLGPWTPQSEDRGECVSRPKSNKVKRLNSWTGHSKMFTMDGFMLCCVCVTTIKNESKKPTYAGSYMEKEAWKHVQDSFEVRALGYENVHLRALCKCCFWRHHPHVKTQSLSHPGPQPWSCLLLTL